MAKEELTVGGRLSADRELGLDELDSKLEDMERELLELNANSERLTRRHGSEGYVLLDDPPDLIPRPLSISTRVITLQLPTQPRGAAGAPARAGDRRAVLRRRRPERQRRAL